MAEMPPAHASDRVTVTQLLGGGPPGEPSTTGWRTHGLPRPSATELVAGGSTS